MELVSLSLQLAFFGVFLVVVWRFMRRRGTIELALVAVFASIAAIFGSQILGRLVPQLAPLMSQAAIVLLLAQPVFILWVVHLIRPQPRWLMGLAIIGFAVAAAALLLPPERVPAALLYVGAYFALAEGTAAAMLLRVAQGRHGLPRLRLRVAALATILFGLAIVVGAAGAAVAAPDAPNPAIVFTQLAALAAGLAYLVAFLPPTWLHSIGQRAIAFDLGMQLVAAPSGTQPEVLWRNLAHAARALLDARHVQIIDSAGTVLAHTAGQLDSSHDEQANRKGAQTTVDIPLATGAAGDPHLIAQIDGRLLFVEEDSTVLRLLGMMAIRAVEREEAMIRLAEASRELESAAAVRASEARFRALLEAVPSAVTAVDGAGTIVWATGPTAQLFGIPVPELTGRRLAELLPSEDVELGFGSAAEGRVRRAELTARRVDGSSLPVDVAASRFELEGRDFQLFVLSDATWRARANQLRDRFLSVLSHELRTPITSIYGGTHLLIGRGERLDADTHQEVLQSVASEAERLLRITENLVVLARVERGADFFDFRPVSLRPVLADFVVRESLLWPQMDIQLDAQPGLPLIAGDEDYLGQVLRNLISNAGKYAGADATVRISATSGDGEVIVRVVDDGPGLTEADAEHVFDLYYRAPETATAPGAGIGLFICRSLVEAMGGRIWAGNAEGGGAELGFSLPEYLETAEEVAVPPPTVINRS